jgi:hypothetical protein
MANSEWKVDEEGGLLFATHHSLFAPYTLVISNCAFWPVP